MSNLFNRATGLLIIEARESNPNGDPDQEGEPRQRDDKGLITGVSFKRKVRDLIEERGGPVWEVVSAELGIAGRADEFRILESRGRNRDEIKKLNKEQFQRRYWDARVFGTTFLESIKGDKTTKPEDVEHFIRAGAVQFGNAASVAAIEITRLTNTNKSGVQEGKDRGMAPLADRRVKHAVYCMPFFVNPTAAVKSGCRVEDIELLKRLIPLAYRHTASHIRSGVEVRHAWFVEHTSPLGSCSDFALLDALTPKYTGSGPSEGWEQYEVPAGLPDALKAKVASCTDLAA
jgi:CRISPR-associated protein Csd2